MAGYIHSPLSSPIGLWTLITFEVTLYASFSFPLSCPENLKIFRSSEPWYLSSDLSETNVLCLSFASLCHFPKCVLGLKAYAGVELIFMPSFPLILVFCASNCPRLVRVSLYISLSFVVVCSVKLKLKVSQLLFKHQFLWDTYIVSSISFLFFPLFLSVSFLSLSPSLPSSILPFLAFFSSFFLLQLKI